MLQYKIHETEIISGSNFYPPANRLLWKGMIVVLTC